MKTQCCISPALAAQLPSADTISRFVRRPAPPARPAFYFDGELLLKEFIARESQRTGRTLVAVAAAVRRGKYPMLQLRRPTGYEVYVSFKPGHQNEVAQ